MILLGDSLSLLPTLPENSVDSIVTDPPYELGFMNKAWDRTGIAFNVELWEECLRVLKPGGYLLSFGGTRTYHRMVCAIEDAGFIIHPLLAWIQSQGFPKATNLSKRFDTEAGVKRVVIGRDESFLRRNPNNTGIGTLVTRSDGTSLDGRKTPYQKSDAAGLITSPSTPEAKQWDGWFYGLQTLKPSIEPICMAQKPISEKRMTDNIRKWGTGAINIDAGRIGSESLTYRSRGAKHLVDQHFQNDRPYVNGLPNRGEPEKTVQGRWPANVLFDEPAAEMLDKQSGNRRSAYPGNSESAMAHYGQQIDPDGACYGGNIGKVCGPSYSDSGGASRYFMVIRSDDVSGNISGKMRDDGTSNGESLVHVQSTPKDVLHGCGNKTMAASQKDLKFTTSMATKPTTGLKTSLFSEEMNTGCCTDDGERIMLSSTGSSIESAKSADNTNLSANSIGEVQVLIRDTARPVQETNLQSGDTRIENIGMPITENTEGTSPSFFYVAKASKKERGESNDHPTVKPLRLIRYLVRLVTPPNGKVLDPFAGSGTTGLACLKEDFEFILIEKDPHNFEIAQNRIDTSPKGC